MTTRSQFATAFLTECKLPVSAENIIALIAWPESERSHTLPGGASFNPFDTTERWTGSTNFNPAGVQNYLSLGDGIMATKATLYNGLYGPIVSALQISDSADTVCARVCASPWGSKPIQSIVNSVRANQAVFDTPIGGSTPVPAPAPAPGPVPQPEPAPAFSLPEADWFGQPSPNPHNHSGYYSATDRAELKPWQARMIARGWNLGPTGADGYFGPDTYKATVAFQKEKGLNVTGLVGPITWAAAWTEPIT
jgi:peptidoglycan hydrolase-like protein with peptidoglycan-binding domain